MRKLTITISIIAFMIISQSNTCNQATNINKAIEGVYTFKNSNSKIIGHLALYSGKYYFTFNENLSKDVKKDAFKFHFAHNLKDNYEIKLKEGINVNSPISNYKNNETIATINFDPKRLTRIRTNRKFLLRADKDKKLIYFHSEKSELQLWNISKSWLSSGISDKKALIIANKAAESKIKNQKSESKINLSIVNGKLFWDILYNYSVSNTNNKIEKKHFTIRVNQKTEKTQFL